MTSTKHVCEVHRLRSQGKQAWLVSIQPTSHKCSGSFYVQLMSLAIAFSLRLRKLHASLSINKFYPQKTFSAKKIQLSFQVIIPGGGGSVYCQHIYQDWPNWTAKVAVAQSNMQILFYGLTHTLHPHLFSYSREKKIFSLSKKDASFKASIFILSRMPT